MSGSDWNALFLCVGLVAGIVAFLAVIELFSISKRLTEIRDELRANAPKPQAQKTSQS